MSRREKRIGHMRAMVSAAGIFLYFALTTVWLPSALLRSPLLTGLDRALADLIALLVWGGAFSLGIWGLRVAQDRDLI